MATNTGKVSVSVKEAIKGGEVHIHIRGKRMFTIRLHIAKLLFHLGAWLIYAKSDVDVDIGDKIETLRQDEGSLIEIGCDNPDAEDPTEVVRVICCGEWTKWEAKEFYATTIAEALAKAVEVYNRRGE